MFYYVYIIKSENFPDTFYIGYTTNLKKRLEVHNSGGDSHTSKYKPWKIKTAIAFTDKQKAISFEKYFKSHLGKACAAKRSLAVTEKTHPAEQAGMPVLQRAAQPAAADCVTTIPID